MLSLERPSATVSRGRGGGNRGARAVGPGGPRGRRIKTELAALKLRFNGLLLWWVEAARILAGGPPRAAKRRERIFVLFAKFEGPIWFHVTYHISACRDG